MTAPAGQRRSQTTPSSEATVPSPEPLPSPEPAAPNLEPPRRSPRPASRPVRGRARRRPRPGDHLASGAPVRGPGHGRGLRGRRRRVERPVAADRRHPGARRPAPLPGGHGGHRFALGAGVRVPVPIGRPGRPRPRQSDHRRPGQRDGRLRRGARHGGRPPRGDRPGAAGHLGAGGAQGGRGRHRGGGPGQREQFGGDDHVRLDRAPGRPRPGSRCWRRSPPPTRWSSVPARSTPACWPCAWCPRSAPPWPRRSGGRIYVCNLRPQPPETAGFTAADHLDAVLDHGVPVDVMVCAPWHARVDCGASGW